MSQDTPSENSESPDAPETAPSPAASPKATKPQDAPGPSEPPASKPTAKKPTPKKPASSGGRGGLWLLLLLIIVLGAGGGYLWQEVANDQHQLDELHGAMQELHTQLQTEREARAREPQQRQQALDQLDQHWSAQWQEQQQALAALGEQLNNAQRRLNAMSATNREGWKLAEAQYLLRLANQRLVMDRDATSALALAEQVATIFQTLNDGRLHNVRRTLAQDIRALRTAEQVDREGIYIQLLSLGEQLQTLPLADPLERLSLEGEGEEADSSEPMPPEADASRWQRIRYRVAQSFRNLRSALSDHLRIRRHDEPIAAQTSTREHFYVRQNLHLMMEQAQVALLREQTDIYRANLERAAQWLEQHYSLNAQTGEVQEELQQLAARSIRTELPDLSGTLAQLNTYINAAPINGDPAANDAPSNGTPAADDQEREP